MTIYINLLIITCLIVWVIDLTDVMDYFKKLIWRLVWGKKQYKQFRMKPLDCSLCMSWWIGIVYILLLKNFTIAMLGYVGLLSFLTPVIKDVLVMIKDMLVGLLNLIYKILRLE